MLDAFSIAKELAGAARIGILQMDGLQVQESPEELKQMLNTLADEYAQKGVTAALGEIGVVKQIRRIFHWTGLDPTRYRPSSESLLRRAAKRKGLYFVNSAVDLVNYFSLKLLWPMGLYDVDKLKPPILWRIGQDGESYEGIGRDRLNLTRFPLLVDQDGPFGSPVSDSMRTRVTGECTRILWITFAPRDADIPLAAFAETMARFNGGTVVVSTAL